MKNSQPMVKMIQEEVCRWRIESESGKILSENIMIGSLNEAEEFVKKYISSFSTWTYEFIPLGGNNVKSK